MRPRQTAAGGQCSRVGVVPAPRSMVCSAMAAPHSGQRGSAGATYGCSGRPMPTAAGPVTAHSVRPSAPKNPRLLLNGFSGFTLRTNQLYARYPGGMTDLLALDRQVCFAVVAASRSIVALYKPILEPLGLTHPQYLVMLALWESSPLRVKDLGERLLLDPATLSPLLKRLEQQGLLTRARDSADERALALALTPAGVALRQQAEQVPGRVIERLGLTIGELESIRDSATALLEASRTATARSATADIAAD